MGLNMKNSQLLILTDIVNGTYTNQRHGSDTSDTSDADLKYLEDKGLLIEGGRFTATKKGQDLIDQACVVSSATLGEYSCLRGEKGETGRP